MYVQSVLEANRIQTNAFSALTTEMTTHAPMTSQKTTMDSSTLLTTDSHLTSQKASTDLTTEFTSQITNRQQSNTESASVSSPTALSANQENIELVSTTLSVTAYAGEITDEAATSDVEQCQCSCAAAAPNSANVADLQNNRCKCDVRR